MAHDKSYYYSYYYANDNGSYQEGQYVPLYGSTYYGGYTYYNEDGYIVVNNHTFYNDNSETNDTNENANTYAYSYAYSYNDYGYLEGYKWANYTYYNNDNSNKSSAYYNAPMYGSYSQEYVKYYGK